MHKKLLRELRDDFSIQEMIPLEGGFLNCLWRAGDLLIKQYSPKRFPPHKLVAIEKALQMQDLLRRDGIPSPQIFPRDGQMLRWLDEENAYVVMEYSQGWNERPESITLTQMKSLGRHCAEMHQAFARIPPEGVKGYPLDCAQVLENVHNHARKVQNLPEYDQSAACRRAVLAMRPILETLSPTFLENLPQGICHEDFTPDNLLFESDELYAIIDFDRSQYSFTWHDIGRALLSFALLDGVLRREYIAAFVEGYAAVLPFDRPADALRVTWCIEAPWWIHPRCFAMEPCKASRHRDEIVWLTVHWYELDKLI